MSDDVFAHFGLKGRFMDFMTATKTCLGKYANFSGRASRPEFWWFFLFQVLALIVSGILGELVYGLVALGLLIPALAVGARRLHDVGRSGWWQLLILTGIGYLVLLFFWVQSSQDGGNKFDEISIA